MNATQRGGGSGLLVWLIAPLTRLFHSQTPRLIAAVVLLLALVAGAYFGWLHWGAVVMSDERFRLSADAIEITPPPAWIRADVKAEVVRDGLLGQLSLADPEATVKIARAFEAHTWVEHVERVTKRAPARVTVDLRYRRPIAMVEVPLGYWPVDASGVLLPVREFSEAQTVDYLHILGANPEPAGPVGTPYGDRRVEQGAVIAVALERYWKDLSLHKIVAGERPSASRLDDPEFDLFTRRGVRLMWGRAPGHERPGEPSAAQKLAKLLEYVEQHGSLDGADGPAELDLRNFSGNNVPRTANLREPATHRD
ncbi:MAG: hypothetical protein R3C99_04295 [Pirellulaceae bacterium]